MLFLVLVYCIFLFFFFFFNDTPTTEIYTLSLHDALPIYLAEAERAYREALLLNPRHLPAKWNLELAVRRRGGSSRNNPPPPGGGGGGSAPPQSGPGGSSAPSTPAAGGLSQAQAEQILRSI